MRYILYLLLMVFSQHTLAKAPSSSTNTKGVQYSPVGQWQFSLGLGAGQKSNPLNGGKAIPLVIVPSLYYYGENFYFDDGTLGYSFIQNDSLIVSAISQLNSNAAYFYRGHPSNVFLPGLEDSALGVKKKRKVDMDSVAKRRWALDAGLQINYFINEELMLQGRWTHDISNVYQGNNAQLKLAQSFRFGANAKFNLKLSLGANWLNSDLVDYYYGISARDGLSKELNYRGRATTNYFVGVSAGYRLTTNWRAVATYHRLSLGNAIADSPLIKESNVNTFFVGVHYDF